MTNFIQRQIRKQADGAVKAVGRTTACRHANNPYGHNPDCNCGWKRRASQVIPYLSPDAWVDVPEPDYPESPHADL